MNTDTIWNELAVSGRSVVDSDALRYRLLDEASDEGVRLEFRQRVTGGTVVYLRRT